LITDQSWHRIITAKDGTNVIRAWGPNELDLVRELISPLGIVSDNGNPYTLDWKVNVYVVDGASHPRVMRLQYDFTDNGHLTFQDTLNLDSDGLVYVGDLDRHDNGTPADPADDYLWVVDQFGYRLVKYNCFGARGIVATCGGTQTGGPSNTPTSLGFCAKVAIGKGLNGTHNDLVYVLDDRWNQIIKLRNVGSDSLVEIDRLALSELSVKRPSDIITDSYGQLYVLDERASKVHKLNPDFDLITTLDNPGLSGGKILGPLAIGNGSSTHGIAGWGDLFIAEGWSNSTGGNWFAIGVDTEPTGMWYIPDDPYTVEFDYTATDPHNLRVNSYYWQGSGWQYEGTRDYGIRFTGATVGERWSIVDTGITRLYRFEVQAVSTYANSQGGPPLADGFEFEATIGNRNPLIVSPLEVVCSSQDCVYENRQYIVTVGATDTDSPGELDYTWTASGDLLLLDPGTGLWATTVSGAWDSLRILALPFSGAPAGGETWPLRRIDVSVEDGGGGVTETFISLSECSGQATPCPYQGDGNADGYIDATDIALATDIVFFGQPSPRDPECPTDRLDWDCNFYVDATDLAFIIDHVFSGGEGPCNPCLPD